MRNPNGYGTVYKLSGNRRKPYIARITKGWEVDTETGKKKQVFVTVGYYQDRSAALQALADYNISPYDINVGQKTFAEVFELWKAKTAPTISENSMRIINSTFKQCVAIHNIRICDIRQRHLQDVLDDCATKYTYATVHKIQGLFYRIFRWCVDNDYLKKSYAENLRNPVKSTETTREAFSTEEIKYLWDNVSQNEYIKVVLILIYSGLRINELLNLKIEDIEIDNQVFFVRKSKTESGIRKVPIADKVLPFWKEFIDKSKCEYAITTVEGERFQYSNFAKRYYTPLMQNLGLTHNIHETRHTCITQMISNGASESVVKWIVGHKSIMSLTERVYTHMDNKTLLAAVNLIP